MTGPVSRETVSSPGRAPRFPWSPADLGELERLVRAGMKRAAIARHLGRSDLAVRVMISRLRLGAPYRRHSRNRAREGQPT